MMTIEEETKHLIDFLSHPAGFSVDMNGQLGILPIYGTIEHWEIYWEGIEDGMNCQSQKIFFTLEEAAIAFVEKRRYMCLGLDFNKLASENIKDETNLY